MLRKSIAARPDDFYPHLLMGNSLRNLNRLDEALAMYREAARLKPGNPDALNCIGWILLAKRRYDEAAAIYRDSLRLAPDNILALESLGRALQELGRIDEAIELYRQAIRIAPDDASPHYKLGGALAEKHRFAEALAEKQEAARLTPDDSIVLHGLGIGFRDLGRFDETEAAFRKSVENQPDNASSDQLPGLAPGRPHPTAVVAGPRKPWSLARRAVKEAPNIATNYNTLGAGRISQRPVGPGHRHAQEVDRDEQGDRPHGLLLPGHGPMAARGQGGGRAIVPARCRRGQEGRPGPMGVADDLGRGGRADGKAGPVPTLFEVKAEPDRAMAALRRMSAAGFLRTRDPADRSRSRPDSARGRTSGS